jgi:hypothetical protein
LSEEKMRKSEPLASDASVTQRIRTAPWVEKMIDDYQATGIIDMEALVRLLGDPTGSVSLTRPNPGTLDAHSAETEDP